MMIGRVKIGFVAGALLNSVVGGVAWYRHSTFWKSASNLDCVSNDRIWRAVSCRVRLYVQKAQGALRRVSWTELWGLTVLGTGFHCHEEDSLQFSSSVNENDQTTGAQIFHERCMRCHCSAQYRLRRSEFQRSARDQRRIGIWRFRQDHFRTRCGYQTGSVGLRLGGTTKAAPLSFTVDEQQMVALAAGRALFVFGR
jgi:hypothetical protein